MTGLSTNKIKWIRSLQQKKIRDELNMFTVEGEKSVREAIHLHPSLIELVLHTDRFTDLNVINTEKINCTESEFKRISSLKNPQGCLVVLRKPKNELGEISNQLTIVLDGIQDPGNMGTILRIADWFGIHQVICSNDTVDCYNPKVVQASMGAILRVKVWYTDLDKWLPQVSIPIYGAMLDGKNIYRENLPKEALILMGNEGNGISRNAQTSITHKITIPSFGGSESLNVAVATGIIVSEFRRK